MPDTTNSKFGPKMILVPTDFSPSASVALETASEMARYLQAEIHLLHVVPMMQPFIDPGYTATFLLDQGLLDDARKDAQQRLDTLVASLQAKGMRATASVEIGNDVSGNILSVIEREHVDMVVLSTHGLSGWKPAIFGSIAAEVTKLVKCPLLLLHSRDVVAAEGSSQRAA